ncbi:MAG: ABC transporter substrate-binding protein [Actinomycetota bacterium]|nr:ABC transporter substrate-binding protein [Actinomycetota bacterium]
MNHRRQYRRSPWLAVPLAASLVLAACGEDEESAPTGAGTQGTSASTGTTSGSTGTTSGSTGGEGALAGICPETVVLQTDWNPEAEHGFVYELIGDGYEIDKDAVATRGPLVDSSGADTGVDFEIRSGGPAIGFETVTSQMYQDEDILLGYVYTDEAIQNAADFPTVAIEAGMDKNPQIIMWDPETYPDVKSIADLGETDATVRFFGGAAYMEYFTSEGILSPDQVDGSYDGTPAAFIADEGAAAQQGFGSAEPFKYENEFAEWGKPVEYEYINDAGWENYGESIATRPENIDEYGECFAALVPMIQQASVDYVTDPAETNELILEAVETYDNGWTYTPEVADYAVETMKKDGLLGNGPDDTLGNFDMDRINGLIEIARPVYAELGQEPPAGLTAEDVATNEFIDPSIGL